MCGAAPNAEKQSQQNRYNDKNLCADDRLPKRKNKNIEGDCYHSIVFGFAFRVLVKCSIINRNESARHPSRVM